MVKEALQKLSDIQYNKLDLNRQALVNARARADRVDEYLYKGRIKGYLSALADNHILTERESMALYIYFTL